MTTSLRAPGTPAAADDDGLAGAFLDGWHALQQVGLLALTGLATATPFLLVLVPVVVLALLWRRRRAAGARPSADA